MIVLSAGHEPAAPGACWPDHSYCEHTVAVGWVNSLVRYLRVFEVCSVVPTGNLLSKVKWINALKPAPTLAVEIHFNSDPTRRGRGSETIYCPGSTPGRIAAELVQEGLSMVLRPSRGAKEGWYRMDKPGHVDYPGDVDGDEAVDYFLKATHCPALIVEPEFIHNRDVIESSRDAACEVLARALHVAAEQLRYSGG